MTTVPAEEYPTGGGLYAVTTGPDGSLWFTTVAGGRIGRPVPGGKIGHHQLDPRCGPFRW